MLTTSPTASSEKQDKIFAKTIFWTNVKSLDCNPSPKIIGDSLFSIDLIT